ncbi:hypothetical protein ACFXTI_014609 [Malus domestica]
MDVDPTSLAIPNNSEYDQAAGGPNGHDNNLGIESPNGREAVEKCDSTEYNESPNGLDDQVEMAANGLVVVEL